MSRPRVSLENYREVYDYYEQHTQSPTFARLGHALLSKLYRPTITFAQGGVAERAIRDEIGAGTRLIISPNHLTGDDQYVVVSVAQKEPVLHPLRGHTFIPAEPSLFTRAQHKGGALLRRAVDGLGAIPIVRLEDLRRQGVTITPEIEELHKKAILMADEVEISKLVNQGAHMAGFWEGTRNRTDHTTVQPLKKGIGHTACKAAEQVDISIVPVGIYYGGEPTDYRKLDVPQKYTPHVHIGMPLRVETANPGELIRLVYPAMQDCVNAAVASSTASPA